LTDRQLAVVVAAAKPLPPEKRDAFLKRFSAMLEMRTRGRRINDVDVSSCATLGQTGLQQQFSAPRNAQNVGASSARAFAAPRAGAWLRTKVF